MIISCNILGDLTVENFFKDITQQMLNKSNVSMNQIHNPVIDNLLIKLDSVTLSRAVMTLAGSLEVQVKISNSNVQFL